MIVHGIVRCHLDAAHFRRHALLLLRRTGQQHQRPEQRHRRGLVPRQDHRRRLIPQLLARKRLAGLRIARGEQQVEQIARRFARGAARRAATIASINAIQRRLNRQRPRSRRSVSMAAAPCRADAAARCLTPNSVSIRRIAAPYARVSSENIERPAMSSARFCIAASRSTGADPSAPQAPRPPPAHSNDMACQQRQRPRRQGRCDGAPLQPPFLARAEQQPVAGQRPQHADRCRRAAVVVRIVHQHAVDRLGRIDQHGAAARTGGAPAHPPDTPPRSTCRARWCGSRAGTRGTTTRAAETADAAGRTVVACDSSELPHPELAGRY